MSWWSSTWPAADAPAAGRPASVKAAYRGWRRPRPAASRSSPAGTRVDTWGLDDRWIAHHGTVTPAYLDRYRPELIAIHGFFSPAAREPVRLVRMRLVEPDDARWSASYAEAHHYLLVSAFGTLHDTEQ